MPAAALAAADASVAISYLCSSTEIQGTAKECIFSSISFSLARSSPVTEADKGARVCPAGARYLRWPSGIPNAYAFCRSAPAVRPIVLAMASTGVLDLECFFSSERWPFDHSMRTRRCLPLVGPVADFDLLPIFATISAPIC